MFYLKKKRNFCENLFIFAKISKRFRISRKFSRKRTNISRKSRKIFAKFSFLDNFRPNPNSYTEQLLNFILLIIHMYRYNITKYGRNLPLTSSVLKIIEVTSTGSLHNLSFLDPDPDPDPNGVVLDPGSGSGSK